MAEYEISHPRIPQIGNTVLKGPDDLPPPTERDFWDVVRQQVRPFGLSQLTDEEKISAYKNGYFDDPEPVEGQPEQPGLVDSLLDLGGKAVLRGGQMAKAITSMPGIKESGIVPLMSEISSVLPSGPYDKLLKLQDKAVPYKKTENADQFREAGKYLFGFLDNTEDKLDFDPVTEALKRTGMPFYSKNKNARGRVKAAAMDYAQDSMVAGMGEGYARAASGGEFLYKGGKLLKDKQLTPTAYDTSPFGDINTPIIEGTPDDSDILDYVNSAIEFDALNHRYENSAELAAFVLENPQESAKAMGAGIIGGLTPIVEAEDLNEILIDEEDINLDSDLQQDIRSGFVQPDVGVSFLSEVVGDPMNLAGGTTAKAVTAPQRVALSGRITKTLNEVNRLNNTKSLIAKELQKAQQRGEQSQRISRQTRNLEAINRQLVDKQKILDKYGRNSLFLRMAAQSSPDELLKVAAKNIDTASDAGKASMNMVYNAMKPSGKIGLVRKGIAMGAKFTPEIAGATIGASMFGPEGAAAGALAPSILKGAKIISTMPENIAISYIMRSATEAGEEITEQAARKQWRGLTAKYLYPAGILGLGGGAVLSSQEGGGGISDSLLKIGGGAFALKFLPKLAQFSDAAMRDSRVIGPELIYARGENSPFFNRLALLPSADEGLIGANADRFQALTRTSSGETILEKAIDKVRPIGRGIVTSVKDEFPTGAPFRPGLSDTNKMLSDPTRKVAQFLDRTPTLGRGLETLGRFGTVVTAGSTLPAAFGYVGSGGQAEGAIAGALVSAPFTSIGAGAGMFQSYKNKSDLFQQKMGDVYYYREHLNKSEQADFDALPMHIRMALSGYSLSHPDIMFQPGTEGRGNFSFNPDLQTSVVEYNKATGAGLIEGVLAHEVGHHIEIHGLTPMVNKLFFGDPVTKEGGVYGKFNDEGEIVPNKEFEDLRDFYLKRLSGDDSINPADADRYQGKEGQQLLVSELFAEQVRDYLLSGKKDKGNTVAEKIIRASSEAMMGTPFVRDFLLKMNLPMKADGKFIEGGFFEGKLRRIPEITKLIDQYYKDTRAMRQREIQGEEVTTPGTNRVDKELSIDSRKAKRPIEGEEFESSFSIKDQNDPAIKAKLDTGGVFKWRPTADGGSELETDATGTPKRYTAKELEKQNRAQGDHAIKVFEKNGVDIITHKDGKKSTGDITNLTPEMIDELAQGPWHPRQIQTLREISRSLREGDGERAGFLIGYFAASTGRKPKAVPFALRKEMPYGFKLTKDGNILALLHDVPQLEKNLKFLKGGRRLPGKYRDEYNQLFDNDTEVWEAFRQYRVNTANGMDGQLGLDDDPSRAIRKKNFLNALHGAIDAEHINLNPILSEISKLKGMDMFNPSKRQPFGPATKTFRLDRIFDVTRSGNRNSNVNVDRAKKLLMPTEIQEGSPGSFFRPKSSRDISAQVRTFKSPVYLKDGSRLSGVADNPEQNPFYGFDKSGQEFSQRREYVNPQDITKSRDSDRTANQIRKELETGQKLFMPASEAGAGKGKQAEAADLDFKISTRNPTAKNATENPITEDLIINTASIADDATMLESHALALQEYPGIKKNSKVPKRIIDRFVDHVVDNLLYLHDQVRPEVRNRSKLWYDGARNITEKWNQKYGNDKQAIAAALASLSPQKDWFMNVDLARRMLDIYKDQSNFAFDKAMAKKYIQLFEKGIGKKKATEIAEAMVGKTLNELQSDFEQAAFIRSYDEVYNPREYQVVSPEGDFIGLAKSLDGVNKKVAWGSMTEISKAVKVLRNPSKESISTALGNAHKIRNFYNNILLPNADEFSVTIDTHAIAAALLRPLAGADLEVANNFGSKPKGAKRSIKNSSVKGISGTYGIYADAYRKAAKARGILPREMQSITWEAVRGLYEAKWKTKSNKAKIDNLWKKYENGELTLNETREQILEAADGIREPEWVTERSDSGTDGGNESSNKSEELYRSELGGSELRANPRGGRTNPRGSKEVNFLPAGNFSSQPANRITRQAPAMPGNRFMLPAASAGARLSERFR